MASEDSEQLCSGLLAIHRLDNLGDACETIAGQMQSIVNHPEALREFFEVAQLRRMQRIRLEERNDRVDQIRSSAHHVAVQMLLVVVVPPVRKYASHAEESDEVVQAGHALRALCYRELVRHLIAGFVASAPRPAWLPDEADGEASLSVYKTQNPAELDQSFLLVFCTHDVVTVPATWDDTRSLGYSVFPAYSQMRTAWLPMRGAAIYLRTVIVTAAVYRGLASLLRTEVLTTPRNLPAPGRRQPLYVVLRLSRGLCFW